MGNAYFKFDEVSFTKIHEYSDNFILYKDKKVKKGYILRLTEYEFYSFYADDVKEAISSGQKYLEDYLKEQENEE